MTDHGEQGERGRTGDTGAAGTTGDTGTTGEAGARGEAGVPGRQGEAGVSGRQGEAGTAGLRGTAGSRGETGRAGRSLSRAQTLSLFVFVLAAFALLAIRSERNAHGIAANQDLIIRNQHDQCVQVAVIARQVNDLADALIRAEARRAQPDLRLPAELVAIKSAVIDCQALP